jgi:Transglutaminase-like superfamily
MQRLHKFCRLPSPSRRLLVKSLLLLGIIRMGLWLLPFRTLRRLLAHMTRACPRWQGGHQAPLKRVVWAVTVASQYVPAATCLTQALATQVLLSRRGHPTSLRIGVARSDAGEFQAHAWVECQGEIVIGRVEALSRFAPFPPLDGEKL